ncbi:MAG: hypothetical protein ACRC6M_09680, partial [Microcystaceae cyanobacterium]
MVSPPLNSKLSHYFPLVLGSSFAIITLVVLVINYYLAQSQIQHQIEDRADTIARGIEYATQDLITSQPLGLTARIIQNYATLPDVIQIELVNPNETTLTSSPNDSRSQKYWQSLRSQFLEKMRLAAKTGENISLMTRHDNVPIFVKILPLNSTLFAEQDRFGLIIVVLDLQEVNNNIGHYFFLSGAISF